MMEAEKTMAMFDLSTYNLGELKGLQFDVEQELRQREREEVRQARERILAIARETGVAVDQLLGEAADSRAKKAAPKARTRARKG